MANDGAKGSAAVSRISAPRSLAGLAVLCICFILFFETVVENLLLGGSGGAAGSAAELQSLKSRVRALDSGGASGSAAELQSLKARVRALEAWAQMAAPAVPPPAVPPPAVPPPAVPPPAVPPPARTYKSPLCGPASSSCYDECNKWAKAPPPPLTVVQPELKVGEVGLATIESYFEFTKDPTGSKGHQGTCGELRSMENQVFCLVGTFAPPDSNIIDGGAHWGETLILMEGAFADTIQIHSFEAMTGNFERASRWATKRTKMNNYALTEQVGVDKLTIECLNPDCDDEHGTLNEQVIEWHHSFRHKQTYPVEVNVLRLDEYIDTLDKPPFFLKLDLEGMDFPIIQTLDLGDAKVITWEASTNTCQPLALQITYLRDRGYEVYRLTPFGLLRVARDYKCNVRCSCFTMLAIAKDVVGVHNDRDVPTCLKHVAEAGMSNTEAATLDASGKTSLG